MCIEMDKIEELLKTSYWSIDILPKQVPKNSPGQYFAVEVFLSDQHAAIMQKHVYKSKRRHQYVFYL